MFSPESIGVIPKFLHRIDSGNSRFSAYVTHVIVCASCCVLLVCAMSVSVHNAQTLRFLPTGVIGLRSLCPEKQEDQCYEYASPYSLIKNLIIEHVLVETLKSRL